MKYYLKKQNFNKKYRIYILFNEFNKKHNNFQRRPRYQKKGQKNRNAEGKKYLTIEQYKQSKTKKALLLLYSTRFRFTKNCGVFPRKNNSLLQFSDWLSMCKGVQ